MRRRCARAERVQRVEAGAFRREVHVRQRRRRSMRCSRRDVGGERIRQFLRKLRQRLEHQRPLHLGRQRAGLFVDRNDAAGVQALGVAGAGVSPSTLSSSPSARTISY